MNTYSGGLVFVLVSTALAVFGMVLVRRRWGVKTLSSYHEVAGNLLSIIGTLYAVLLGFVVVDAMEKQQELRIIVEQEANACANIFLLSHGLNDPCKSNIQKHCHAYAEAVINREWEAMTRSSYSPEAVHCTWSLWKEITTLKPENTTQTTVHDKLLDQLSTLSDNRRFRVVSAAHGTAPALWAILIIGGVFTVVFTYFFAVENLRVQVLMTTLVALTLALNVLLVFLFGTPFAGELGIRPDAFKLDLLIFKFYEQGTLPPTDHIPLIEH